MTLDDATAVVGEAEVVIKAGERVLVAGESGTGKSTLVRAIAGLWPWGGGSVNFHADRRLFMLPQRPYVPSARCAALPPIPPPPTDWTMEADRRSARQGGPRSSQGQDRGRGAVGPDACREAKSSGSPSRGCFCTSPISSCWMKRPLHSMRRVRTR